MSSQDAHTSVQYSDQYIDFGFIELKKKGSSICATVCGAYEDIIEFINEAESFTTSSPN